MKTIKCLTVIATTVFLFSCNKNASHYMEVDAVAGINQHGYCGPGLELEPEEVYVMFCNQTVVPLCTNNTPIGSVTVKTASDGNIYVVFKTTGTWFLKEMYLFAGEPTAMPSTASGTALPDLFPFSKIYNTTLTKEYTFVVPDMPTAFTVAATAEVVRLSLGNSSILEEATAWANGCGGNTRMNIGQ